MAITKSAKKTSTKPLSKSGVLQAVTDAVGEELSRKHVKLYIRALREGKNEILGIVLNGLSPRRIEYYSNYRYYRSYKKYYGAQT